MLDQMDWDAYWRFELFRRACDPLDFRRWKRDSQRALRGLYPGAVRLLDSTAGLGDHTVNLAEEGFDVEACDDSEVALAATRHAVEEAGLAVPVFRARWESLGRAGRYDVIFNDALHWVYEPDLLRAALRGFFAALRPGGALVFFFADARQPEPRAGIDILEWDWQRMERARIAWEHEREGRAVTLTVVAERGPDFIDEHHLFVERPREGRSTLTAFTVRRVYRWDFHALSALLADVGFTGMRSDHFENVKGHTFAMSRAFKPE